MGLAARRLLQAKTKLQAPIAEQIPHQVVFGKVEGENRGAKPFSQQRKRTDPWFWLRDDDRKDAKVLAHLHKEKDYVTQQTSHLEATRKELYDEHIGHLKETDDNPPTKEGAFFYYNRTVQGLSYSIHARKPVKGDERMPLGDAQEEIILDVNKVAEGHSQCVVSCVRVSPDHTKLFYAVDFNGQEIYQLVVLDLKTGKVIDDNIKAANARATWGDDNTLFYLTKDDTQRSYRLHRHTIGANTEADVLLMEEPDEQFSLFAYKSKSSRFLVVGTDSTETYQRWYIDLKAGVESPMVLVQAKEFGLRYDIYHDGRDHFYILTNKDKAVNNKLMRTPITQPGQEHWQEVLAYDPARMLDSLEIFQNHLALCGREGGLTRLWLLEPGTTTLKQAKFEEELYQVAISASGNMIMDDHYMRIYYSSLVTPDRWSDYDMRTGAQVLIKEKDVLKYDRTKYTCKRVWATAADKTKIPISMVYAKSLGEVPGSGPKSCMLYGYGSYGICIDPSFTAGILPYLDRGMVYCIAHVRGGGEMGRPWYEEQGKYLNKRNTFSDFIACAEYLIKEGYTTPSQLAAEGRSAGGLLMGAVVNMRPDLFKVVVAGVPFVDVMNTMSDPSIPLTTGEWEEWGNPNEAEFFDYMLSYSPYDNVRNQPYPHILITGGLYDPRVAYWEPVKWASKLRTMKTDSNEVLVKMDLEAGHFSASDRYKYLREKAFEQAVVLDKLGLVKK